MDSATLVGNDVETGFQIVSRLDETKLRPKIALWMTTPEYDEGRLVLAAPELDRTERLKAYEAIARVLHGRFEYSLTPILLLKMKDPFIKVLRNIFSHASSVQGMRLGGQMIGNRFVTDGYVYRVE